LIHNVQDWSVLLNNAVRLVMCDDLHFAYMWKMLE